MNAQITRHKISRTQQLPAGNGSTLGLVLRLLAYCALPTVCVWGFLRLAIFYGDFQIVFRDNRLVEWAQVLALAATVLCLCLAGRKHTGHREALYGLALCFVIAITRELDNFFEKLFMDNAWKAPASILGLITLVYYLRHRRAIHSQLRSIISSRGSMLVCAGFFIVFSFSRLIGQKIFWHAILQENYLRIVKRVCEETCEFAGYCLILAGAFEILFEKLEPLHGTKGSPGPDGLGPAASPAHNWVAPPRAESPPG